MRDVPNHRRASFRLHRASNLCGPRCSPFDRATETAGDGVKQSKAKRGGRRDGAGAKKDPERAKIGRDINLTTQGMPVNAAEQIVQHLLQGDRERARALAGNMILGAHREEALALAEECARLLAPYPDLWGLSIQAKPPTAAPTPEQIADRTKATAEAASLLRRIAATVDRQRAATVVNHAFAGQPLKRHGEIIEKDELRLAAVNRIKQTAQEERAYWKLVFALVEKDRAGTLTLEDVEELQRIAPENPERGLPE
jgi:hypothetical protein